MTSLNTTCYTIQDGAVVESTLADFDNLIESTTRPTGVGYKYYTRTVEREIEAEEADDDGNVIKAAVRGPVWALAKWATWGGPEVIVEEFESEEAADAAAERTYVYDILHSQEVEIFLDRAEAERVLADILADNE